MANKNIFPIVSVLLLTGCNYSEPMVSADQVIVSINADPSSIPADGVSTAAITVELPSDLDDTMRSVTLSTTQGGLDLDGKNSITINANDVDNNGTVKKIASTYLTSNTTEGTATITVTVSHFVKQKSISFVTATPDVIVVQVDKTSYKPDVNAEITVTTIFKRATGNVSQGQTFDLKAEQSGTPIGMFRNKTTEVDTAGKAVNYFSIAPGTGYTGPVTFTVVSGSITASASITVIN